MESGIKPIRFSNHALLSSEKRGASEDEIVETIRNEVWEPAKRDKWFAKRRFVFDAVSPANGKRYRWKTVEAVFKAEEAEIVVVTVKVYYKDEVIK